MCGTADHVFLFPFLFEFTMPIIAHEGHSPPEKEGKKTFHQTKLMLNIKVSGPEFWAHLRIVCLLDSEMMSIFWEHPAYPHILPGGTKKLT